MPKRTQKKRQQRRQRTLEKDFNTNGYDMDHRGGSFSVYCRKTKTYVARGLSWEKAQDVWNEIGTAIILQDS